MIFLKLGGSLITDKTGIEAFRPKVMAAIAAEIRQALDEKPIKLLLGHGSGSFGHVHAAKYGTRSGVNSAEQWMGFAQVSAAASRINALVRDGLLSAEIPVLSLTSHSSAVCDDGLIVDHNLDNIERAFSANLIPLIMGDVAFDTVRGGTIISTEEIMSHLALTLQPQWLLLAGETEGVLDLKGNVIPKLTRDNLAEYRAALGGSHGTDVTGGMLAKVLSMLELVAAHPQMKIRIFTGKTAGNVRQALTAPDEPLGTVIEHLG